MYSDAVYTPLRDDLLRHHYVTSYLSMMGYVVSRKSLVAAGAIHEILINLRIYLLNSKTVVSIVKCIYLTPFHKCLFPTKEPQFNTYKYIYIFF